MSNNDKIVKLAIENIYRKYLINTLYYVHKLYPKLFKKSSLHKEISKINIKYKPFSSDTKSKFAILLGKKVKIHKNKNTGKYVVPLKKINKIVDPNFRCIARIWANGKVAKVGAKIIYGARCSNEIKHGISPLYCGIHLNNKNKHGDYNKEVSDNIKLEYKKNSKIYEAILK
jgi:hypothetical protein